MLVNLFLIRPGKSKGRRTGRMLQAFENDFVDAFELSHGLPFTELKLHRIHPLPQLQHQRMERNGNADLNNGGGGEGVVPWSVESF